MYNVCALITIYYPDKTIVENIRTIEKQVSHIIIADNTPCMDNSSLFMNNDKIFYYANKVNMGLSKAFNKCLRHDNAINSDYIIFFDQDAILPERLVDTMIDDYNRLRKNNVMIGCLGPIYYEQNSMKVLSVKNETKMMNHIFSVRYIMTSSMLTTYSNLEKIGFWNEEIFLDLADWDLCWRFKAFGLGCFITENVILHHTLGKSIKKIGLFSVKEAVPIREYYQIRDCLKLLFKEYTPLKYRIRFILMITVRSIIHILVLPEKCLRMKFIFWGIIDFFCSVNGLVDLRKRKK